MGCSDGGGLYDLEFSKVPWIMFFGSTTNFWRRIRRFFMSPKVSEDQLSATETERRREAALKNAGDTTSALHA
jgi:hypothetical protein